MPQMTPAAKWFRQEVSQAAEERRKLELQNIVTLSWQESLLSYPVLSSLMLQLYRTTPPEHPLQATRLERFYDLARALNSVLPNIEKELSDDQLLGLAYALDKQTFLALPAIVKKRVTSHSRYDESYVAEPLSLRFVLGILQRAHAQKLPLSELEELSLRYFFAHYTFYPAQQRAVTPIEQEFWDFFMAAFDGSLNTEQRAQWLSLFLEAPTAAEFRKRHQKLQSCASWGHRDRWAVLEIISQKNIGCSLSVFIGTQTTELIARLPQWESLFEERHTKLCAARDTLYERILGLIDYSSKNWSLGLWDVAQVRQCRKYRPFEALDFTAGLSLSLRHMPSLIHSIGSFCARNSGAWLQGASLPLRTGALGFLGYSSGYLQVARLGLQQRNRLAYCRYTVFGLNPYQAIQDEIQKQFPVFLQKVYQAADLSSCEAELERLFTQAHQPYVTKTLGVTTDPAPLASVSDYDMIHRETPEKQVHVALEALFCQAHALRSMLLPFSKAPSAETENNSHSAQLQLPWRILGFSQKRTAAETPDLAQKDCRFA